MRHQLIYLSLVFGLFLMSFTAHKYYISLTKIKYVEEENAVQVTMRFFIDDIELALENRHALEMELATKDEHPQADAFLEGYLRKKFKIWINEEEKEFTYLGKEYENDEIFFYVELQDVSSIQSIEVQNSMLLETYEDQQNYIKLKVKDVHKTFIFMKAHSKEALIL